MIRILEFLGKYYIVQALQPLIGTITSTYPYKIFLINAHIKLTVYVEVHVEHVSETHKYSDKICL